jgi:hypothetical protein
MNRKIRCITQGGLATKSLNEALDMRLYKVRPEFGFGGWFAVPQLAHQQLKNLTPSLRQGW